MKINITSEKEHLMDFLVSYLNKVLLNEKAECQINGIKYEGKFTQEITVEKANESYYILKLYISEQLVEVPVSLSNTKARMRGNTVFLETETHTTLIEKVKEKE